MSCSNYIFWGKAYLALYLVCFLIEVKKRGMSDVVEDLIDIAIRITDSIVEDLDIKYALPRIAIAILCFLFYFFSGHIAKAIVSSNRRTPSSRMPGTWLDDGVVSEEVEEAEIVSLPPQDTTSSPSPAPLSPRAQRRAAFDAECQATLDLWNKPRPRPFLPAKWYNEKRFQAARQHWARLDEEELAEVEDITLVAAATGVEAAPINPTSSGEIVVYNESSPDVAYAVKDVEETHSERGVVEAEEVKDEPVVNNSNNDTGVEASRKEKHVTFDLSPLCPAEDSFTAAPSVHGTAAPQLAEPAPYTTEFIPVVEEQVTVGASLVDESGIDHALFADLFDYEETETVVNVVSEDVYEYSEPMATISYYDVVKPCLRVVPSDLFRVGAPTVVVNEQYWPEGFRRRYEDDEEYMNFHYLLFDYMSEVRSAQDETAKVQDEAAPYTNWLALQFQSIVPQSIEVEMMDAPPSELEQQPSYDEEMLHSKTSIAAKKLVNTWILNSLQEIRVLAANSEVDAASVFDQAYERLRVILQTIYFSDGPQPTWNTEDENAQFRLALKTVMTRPGCNFLMLVTELKQHAAADPNASSACICIEQIRRVIDKVSLPSKRSGAAPGPAPQVKIQW